MKKIVLVGCVMISSVILAQKQDSLEIKIGQMLMMGIGNKTAISENSAIAKAIQDGKIGGILLFEKNISKTNSKETLQKLTKDLQSYSSTPLLISIDQEGGLVNRMKTKYGFPESVTAKYLGDQDDLTLTKKYADSTAKTLNEVGINVNYAPVVDVDNPLCPVIGKHGRAYSSDTDKIVKHASQVVESHRNHDVRTALKHFPGHGNSRTDSHKGIADVTNYWKESEVEPYTKMMKNGEVDAIMVGHIVNKKLDPSGLPASLSKKIITNYLRNDLGYDGLVFTDDLQMHAITKYYGFEEGVKKAVLAGNDILMFSNHIPMKGRSNVVAEDVVKIIEKMVKDGELSEEQINNSYKRIQEYKKGLK
ncbi:beta-N-acetylhexosaminidase [Flavobacteriaceae bacterium UJ101]|nr:beta-N-acetylhexosaminidase [Flavobacteriaceae bacterium UJ101]